MPESPQILVVTAQYDPTADLVVRHLNDRGVPFLRLDTRQFPAEVTLTAETSGDQPWRGDISDMRRRLRLESLRSIYVRRPSGFRMPSAMPVAERRWATEQARLGFWGILATLPVLWVNEPIAKQATDCKPLQLRWARQAGLCVPDTLITNDSAAVASFARRHGGQIITKPLTGKVTDEDEQPAGVLYACPVGEDRWADPSIHATAHLLQQRIDKTHDVRLTIVGAEFFAAEIHAGSDAARLDWRTDYPSLTYKPCDVPRYVRNSVATMMSELGLLYSAFDFAVTRDGEWWFLEVNPNGQFGFIELATGLPISAAIATMLEKGPRW